LVKLEALDTVPVGAVVLVTLILPVVAAAGTTAFSCVEETKVLLADTPLNLTLDELLKPTPVMVTVVPAAPLVGLKPVIESVTVKFDALVAVPGGVVTLIRPLVAPLGTVALIWLELEIVKLAALPLKVTELAPQSALPLIATSVPVRPDEGVKPEIDGVVNAVTL
jgi:hypothetical protein